MFLTHPHRTCIPISLMQGEKRPSLHLPHPLACLCPCSHRRLHHSCSPHLHSHPMPPSIHIGTPRTHTPCTISIHAPTIHTCSIRAIHAICMCTILAWCPHLLECAVINSHPSSHPSSEASWIRGRTQQRSERPIHSNAVCNIQRGDSMQMTARS